MKVSICIPVYNVENLIGRCLDSVVKQSFSNLEIIIVNDCTPDNSMQIVNQYAQKDHRIKIFNHEKNLGLMMTRKTGYMAATGDYIIFCDSDDYLPKYSVEKLIAAAESNNADVVIGLINYIGDCSMSFKSVLKYGNDKESVFKSLLRKEAIHNLWGKIYRREILQNYEYKTFEGCINSEDLGAFYQIVNNCKTIVTIDEDVYNYCQNNASSSLSDLSEKALASMVRLRVVALEILEMYPRLKKDMYNWLLFDLNILYPKYNKHGQLNKLIENYGLSPYLKFSKLLKYGDFMNVIKFAIKRNMLFSFLNK